MPTHLRPMKFDVSSFLAALYLMAFISLAPLREPGANITEPAQLLTVTSVALDDTGDKTPCSCNNSVLCTGSVACILPGGNLIRSANKSASLTVRNNRQVTGHPPAVPVPPPKRVETRKPVSTQT